MQNAAQKITQSQSETRSAAAGHTQGPWKLTCPGTVVDARISYRSIGLCGENWEICTLMQPRGCDDDVFEADARLIAAAPELLAALKNCRDALGISKDFLPFGVPHELAKQIDTAIAKAEGR